MSGHEFYEKIILKSRNQSVIDLALRVGVYGLCMRKGQILMVQTQSGSRLIYNFPGGAMDDGESLLESLKRECREELGCNVIVRDLVHVSERLYQHPDFNNKSFHLYYLIDLDRDVDPSAHGARWFFLMIFRET